MDPQDACYYEPKSDLTILNRRLPHWHQAGTLAFVTFRLGDSLPGPLIKQLTQERALLLEEAGIDPNIVNLNSALSKMPARDASVLRWKLFIEWDAKLDSLHGGCWLRQPEISKIVSDGLLKFDRDRYVMAAFVIMPNHVHLLAAFREPELITEQGNAGSERTLMAGGSIRSLGAQRNLF